jgi:superoxide dismutase
VPWIVRAPSGGLLAGFKPLLVDVWEHAFMRDYQATERGKYIAAFFRNID